MVFIYHFEDHPEFSLITEKLFDAVEKGKYRAVTSFVSLIEILVKPKREGAAKAVADYRDLLLTFPNLEFVPIDLHVADIASSLRAKYAIRTPDAIQLATAITSGASAFITNDDKLTKIEEIKTVLLRNWKK